MKTYKSYIFIEKDPTLFGISIIDLLLVLGIFIGIILFGGFLYVLGIFWPSIFGLALFMALSLLIFLKMMNKNRQPNYLISLIAFHFLQPKIIFVQIGNLTLGKLYPEKPNLGNLPLGKPSPENPNLLPSINFQLK